MKVTRLPVVEPLAGISASVMRPIMTILLALWAQQAGRRKSG